MVGLHQFISSSQSKFSNEIQKTASYNRTLAQGFFALRPSNVGFFLNLNSQLLSQDRKSKKAQRQAATRYLQAYDDHTNDNRNYYFDWNYYFNYNKKEENGIR